MESDRRKVYVEVNVTHRPDGTARPNFIKFENDEKYEMHERQLEGWKKFRNAVRLPPKSEEPVSATRYRFAASPHFCSTKKTESGL